jgi:Leucine-rich repeat (LRR) protein
MKFDTPSSDTTLQLFLHGNSISHLPPQFYQISPLSVLSLRKLGLYSTGTNQLAEISWEIERLGSLRELSLGHNQLRFLPVEIKKLRIQTLLLHPNPWYDKHQVEEFNETQQRGLEQ